MMADDCIFCRIARGEIPSAKVYEDDLVFAFLDIGPVSEGHCLVIPKDHFVGLADCSDGAAEALGRALGRIADAVVKVCQAEGYNILNNCGRSAGQLVDHLHFHISPRRTGDGLFRQWPAGEYSAGRIDEIAADIRARL